MTNEIVSDKFIKYIKNKQVDYCEIGDFITKISPDFTDNVALYNGIETLNGLSSYMKHLPTKTYIWSDYNAITKQYAEQKINEGDTFLFYTVCNASDDLKQFYQENTHNVWPPQATKMYIVQKLETSDEVDEDIKNTSNEIHEQTNQMNTMFQNSQNAKTKKHKVANFLTNIIEKIKRKIKSKVVSKILDLLKKLIVDAILEGLAFLGEAVLKLITSGFSTSGLVKVVLTAIKHLVLLALKWIVSVFKTVLSLNSDGPNLLRIAQQKLQPQLDYCKFDLITKELHQTEDKSFQSSQPVNPHVFEGLLNMKEGSPIKLYFWTNSSGKIKKWEHAKQKSQSFIGSARCQLDTAFLSKLGYNVSEAESIIRKYKSGSILISGVSDTEQKTNLFNQVKLLERDLKQTKSSLKSQSKFKRFLYALFSKALRVYDDPNFKQLIHILTKYIAAIVEDGIALLVSGIAFVAGLLLAETGVGLLGALWSIMGICISALRIVWSYVYGSYATIKASVALFKSLTGKEPAIEDKRGPLLIEETPIVETE